MHLLRYADDDLVGYAQVAAAGTPDAVAELVVDPAHRRRGHGRALLDAVLAEGTRSVWAHGMLPAADALARAAGLELTRSLHRMKRPLTDCRCSGPRTAAWVLGAILRAGRRRRGLGAAQRGGLRPASRAGRLTVDDLHERMAQPWFDPAGLLLVVDDATGEVVAFHWTKVEPGPGTGEVYVVGVDPAHQGRGLGGPVTRLGLAHLARQGLAEVELYVDGDNTAARRTYDRLGFTDAAVDGQYTLAAT